MARHNLLKYNNTFRATVEDKLDVFDVEALPLDHPFRRLENTVITPHLGYVSIENYRCFYGAMVDDIRGWLAGSPINVMGAD